MKNGTLWTWYCSVAKIGKKASLRYKLIRNNNTLRRLRLSITIILTVKRGKRKADT
jgi:hypothetical protein